MIKHALVTLALLLGASLPALAQSADTPYQLRAVTGLKSHDAVVVTNSNASAAILCANVYALDADDGHLLDCCTCPVPPDALRAIPIVTDVLGNAKPKPKAVVVKLLGSTGTCNADAASPLATGMVASWKGEDPLVPATLSAAEYAALQNGCTALHASALVCGACQAN